MAEIFVYYPACINDRCLNTDKVWLLPAETQGYMKFEVLL